MKKKLLTTLLAAVLCTPQVAFAARDGEGMEYTSAAEGFYGSIRSAYVSKNQVDGSSKDNGSVIDPDGSRLGVRGSLDLGSGLTGLYRYEWSVASNNGSNPGNTRLHYVGLRGGFGEFVAGSHWENDYNWVTAGTDVASAGSGNFAPHFRRAQSFQYTTPNLQGFTGSFRFTMDGKNKMTGNSRVFDAESMSVSIGSVNAITVPATTLTYESENVDEWAVAAKYETHGFTFAGAYEVRPDALRAVAVDVASPVNGTVTATPSLSGEKEDATFWALRMGYGQDNWNVNAWYGEHNDSDMKLQAAAMGTGNTVVSADLAFQDRKIFSVAGDISLGKFGVVGLFEQHENNEGIEDSVFVFNVDYKFTSRSKAYLVYKANDYDSNPNRDDQVILGLRMDF